jgi:hypothetical protein
MSETATGRAAVLELRGVSKAYGQGVAERRPGWPVNSNTVDTPLSRQKTGIVIRPDLWQLHQARSGIDLTLRRQRVCGNGESLWRIMTVPR